MVGAGKKEKSRKEWSFFVPFSLFRASLFLGLSRMRCDRRIDRNVESLLSLRGEGQQTLAGRSLTSDLIPPPLPSSSAFLLPLSFLLFFSPVSFVPAGLSPSSSTSFRSGLTTALACEERISHCSCFCARKEDDMRWHPEVASCQAGENLLFSSSRFSSPTMFPSSVSLLFLFLHLLLSLIVVNKAGGLRSSFFLASFFQEEAASLKRVYLMGTVR